MFPHPPTSSKQYDAKVTRHFWLDISKVEGLILRCPQGRIQHKTLKFTKSQGVVTSIVISHVTQQWGYSGTLAKIAVHINHKVCFKQGDTVYQTTLL